MRQVAVLDDYARVELWSLVLLSAAIGHRLEKIEAGWAIRVAAADYESARWELAAFAEENRNWPPPRPQPPPVAPGAGRLALAAAGGLACFYSFTGPWIPGNPWFQKGMIDGRAILYEGQWWRIITALTLHADINHLLGNISLGALVLYYLGLETGAGAALFLALLTGAAGNLLNVYLHGGGHQSVGFSTAVFGMIGALAGLRLLERGRGLKGILLPLGAGAGMLAMFGASGAHTDLGAHLWGIAVGILAGLLCRKLFDWRPVALWRLPQVALALATIIVILAAWYLAMR
jgi:membrane associated rhomboid family serine protease